jgi:hypothetical protein
MTGWLIFAGCWVLSVALWYVAIRQLHRDRCAVADLYDELQQAVALQQHVQGILTECLVDAQALHEDDEEWPSEALTVAVKRTH